MCKTALHVEDLGPIFGLILHHPIMPPSERHLYRCKAIRLYSVYCDLQVFCDLILFHKMIFQRERDGEGEMSEYINIILLKSPARDIFSHAFRVHSSLFSQICPSLHVHRQSCLGLILLQRTQSLLKQESLGRRPRQNLWKRHCFRRLLQLKIG